MSVCVIEGERMREEKMERDKYLLQLPPLVFLLPPFQSPRARAARGEPICVCVCVCVCGERERERDRER